MVWPILPFFWFDIFRVHSDAINRDESSDDRGRILLSRKKPTSKTRNCIVRVAVDRWDVVEMCFCCDGERVYSPTRSR